MAHGTHLLEVQPYHGMVFLGGSLTQTLHVCGGQLIGSPMAVPWVVSG